MPYIGQSALEKIHSATLDRFIRDRKAAGITACTLNRDMAIIRRVLKFCGVMNKAALARYCAITANHPGYGTKTSSNCGCRARPLDKLILVSVTKIYLGNYSMQNTSFVMICRFSIGVN